ncbi:MAG TPA: FkbM family methyltransferase [Saprospiraceae bacterium]|nr:FkbM family methyltransferase [Saprospiraceae bacterium]
MWKHLSKIKSRITSHQLTNLNPLSALYRYIFWQFYYRFIRKYRIVNWVKPLKIKLQKGAHAVNAQYYLGLADFPEMAFTMHFLREHDLFIDIGAYQGMYSLLAAGIGKSNVLAFEPDEQSFHSLQYQFILNKLDKNIDYRQIALGDKNAKGSLTEHKSQQNHIETDSQTEPNISIHRLDDEVAKLNNPCLLKLDAEGYELNILKGAANILANTLLKAIIIEMMELGSRYGSSDIQVHNVLLQHGFGMYQYDAFKRELIVQSQLTTGNMIYIRDLDFVKQRLVSAKVFTVLGKEI